MGGGATTVNSEGGIAIISGSTNANAAALKADMVFGRVGANTWGAGVLDTQSGSIASVAGMTVTNLRGGVLEVANANNSLALIGADLKVASAADLVLSPGGGEVVVSGSVLPNADNSRNLGSAALSWNDLFFGDGSIIDFNSDVTITHAANVLTVAGGDLLMNGAQKITFGDANNGINLNTDLVLDASSDITLDAAGGNIKPGSNDQAALGVATQAFSDLFLATGAVINIGNGQFTATQEAAGRLVLGAGNLLAFGDRGDGIFGNGTDLFISSSNDMNVIARGGDIALVGAGVQPGTIWSRAAANTQYFNFSTNDALALTAGTAGFGIRNNNGTMQFKNSGGSWTTFGAGASADKKSLLVSGSGIPSGARAHIGAFDVSSIPVADREDRIDAYVNGQLLLSGAFTGVGDNADYILDEVEGANACDIRVQFPLVDQDILTVVVR